MRPAFSSTRQAAAFALLLLALLLSPVLVGKSLLPPREQLYASKGWGSGPYPWIQNQLFGETNDIDIALLGSSHILHAINTPYLQDQLSRKLGRPAVVRTIAWGGAGYDALYFVTQDLLAHRRVRMLVFYDENSSATPNGRNAQIPMLFRFGDDAAILAGLPVRDQSLYYFAAVIGLPRNLLDLVRPNLPTPLVSSPPNYWERHYGSASIVGLLGATRSELGFNSDPLADNFAPFTPFAPATAATPADVAVYSPATKNEFEFSRAPVPAWQVHFARQLAVLARNHGCGLAMLSLPVLADAPVPVIRERAFWPDLFQGEVAMIGIAPAKLFGGLTDEQLHWLFTNSSHFNKNGMDYFTALVTPVLVSVYENQPGH